MEFVASKFNAESDPDRPVLDSEIEYQKEIYLVKKVDHLLLSDVIAETAAEPNPDGFDMVLTKQHSERAVIWVLWVNKKI